MQIKQWEDTNLAQFSYAILSDCEKKIVLIDPSRNPEPYFDYAQQNDAIIIGIIETHPHADFISSHVEISNATGATIYTSKLVDAGYVYMPYDEGNSICFGKIKLTALNTPGHSPDSISILLEHDGKQKAVFSGDTLFIGDCGRPDLREDAGNLTGTRLELAQSMYHTLRDKFISLNDELILYPAHGAGTLCGKGLSKANSSTMGREKQTNWALQSMTETEFTKRLLSDQPFIPSYFPFDVDINRKGAPPFKESIEAIEIGAPVKSEIFAKRLDKDVVIIDARNDQLFKQGHLPNSINLLEGAKFETWLGSIIKPHEQFYLAAENKEQINRLLVRVAAIGYEAQIIETFILDHATCSEAILNVHAFIENLTNYTIVDVRNASEVKESQPFANSITIPLHELRSRVNEIPTNKPIVVHCAGGYRSAAGSSLISSALDQKVQVFDLGKSIRNFQ